MRPLHPYACRRCEAASYRPLIERDGSGALRPTSTFACTGCGLVFTDQSTWRRGKPGPADDMRMAGASSRFTASAGLAV